MAQVFAHVQGGRSEYVDVEIHDDASARIVRQVLDDAGESETTWDLTPAHTAALRAALAGRVDERLAPASDEPGFGRALADAIAALEPPAVVHSWMSRD